MYLKEQLLIYILKRIITKLLLKYEKYKRLDCQFCYFQDGIQSAITKFECLFMTAEIMHFWQQKQKQMCKLSLLKEKETVIILKLIITQLLCFDIL